MHLDALIEMGMQIMPMNADAGAAAGAFVLHLFLPVFHNGLHILRRSSSSLCVTCVFQLFNFDS